MDTGIFNLIYTYLLTPPAGFEPAILHFAGARDIHLPHGGKLPYRDSNSDHLIRSQIGLSITLYGNSPTGTRTRVARLGISQDILYPMGETGVLGFAPRLRGSKPRVLSGYTIRPCIHADSNRGNTDLHSVGLPLSYGCSRG